MELATEIVKLIRVSPELNIVSTDSMCCTPYPPAPPIRKSPMQEFGERMAQEILMQTPIVEEQAEALTAAVSTLIANWRNDSDAHQNRIEGSVKNLEANKIIINQFLSCVQK